MSAPFRISSPPFECLFVNKRTYSNKRPISNKPYFKDPKGSFFSRDKDPFDGITESDVKELFYFFNWCKIVTVSVTFLFSIYHYLSFAFNIWLFLINLFLIKKKEEAPLRYQK